MATRRVIDVGIFRITESEEESIVSNRLSAEFAPDAQGRQRKLAALMAIFPFLKNEKRMTFFFSPRREDISFDRRHSYDDIVPAVTQFVAANPGFDLPPPAPLPVGPTSGAASRWIGHTCAILT
jgi:hypothetical protein